jgi:hypothetical protein
MNTLTGDNFDEGFVQTCIDSGLNMQQTEALHKIATYAKAFDKKEFMEGFNRVVGPYRAENMSAIEKASCVKDYLETLSK